jgi:ADP-ribosylglycohydrolase
VIRPHRILGGLVGLVVGDALGVPVDHESRGDRATSPVTGLTGGGMHGQPAGSWSGEVSLALCTTEALLDSYSAHHLAGLFARFLQEGYWTPRGEIFRLNDTTRDSIARICSGVPAERSGSGAELENDTGALVRVFPIAMAFSRWSIPLMLERVHEASRITHAHPRAQMASGLLALTTRNLVYQRAAGAAYRYAMEDARRLYLEEPWRSERKLFRRVLRGTIGELQEEQIVSDREPPNALEAAFWAFQKFRTFPEAVLKAVNLGGDTPTVGALAGGLAGIAHGIDAIPKDWIDNLARKEEVLGIAERFAAMVCA